MHDVTFNAKTLDAAAESELNESGTLPRPSDVLTIVALSAGLWALLAAGVVALIG